MSPDVFAGSGTVGEVSTNRGGPSSHVEQELLAAGASRVAGIDEAGRGPAAGPVVCGVVVVTEASLAVPAPPGLRDSKLLSVAQRRSLRPDVQSWAAQHAVGLASAEEIDEHGINAALRLAALRALSTLGPVDVVLLDGSYDWISATPTLFEPEHSAQLPPVVTRVKADRDCVSVAAASILAKQTHDEIMGEIDLRHPQYGFRSHHGYLTAQHIAAVNTLGLCVDHRRSWRIPRG